MKNKIFIFFAAAFLAAVSTGCSVNEEGIMGSFPYLEVDVESKNITKVASSEAISIRTNRKVSASVVSEQGAWLTAVVEGDQLVLSWKDNELETTRVATITLTTPNGLVTRTLSVVQDASGELTFDGDLILHSKAEIEKNTYTKTTGDLIIGNVTNVVTKATSASVSVDLGDKVYTASASDVSDADMEVVKEGIHMIGGNKIAVINTNVRTFPVDLMTANGIDELYFDFNDMSALPSADVIQSLKLKKLSLRDNKISDISVLSGCNTIQSLDISGNEVYDLAPIAEMDALETVVLDDLPLTSAQLEIFLEQNPGLDVVAESLRTEDSPLPLFGNMEITVLSETQVQIAVPLLDNLSGLSTVGFYIGNRRELDKMAWNGATLADGILSMVYDVETLENVIYYVRAYAENEAGGNYSQSGFFGSMTSEEDIYIKSVEDLQKFYDDTYSHVNGSVFVGKSATSGSTGVKLDDGRYNMYFRSSDMSDLSKLSQLVYVRDGLYIGNAGLKSLNQIAHISGMHTLWLRGNKIERVPGLAGAQTVKYLDLSMNKLADIAFLDQFTALETLYLGSSDKPQNETNEIGTVDGLAEYTDLKFIDLSGLPLHEWQVEDLRAAMPNTEIVFSAGGREPHIPTVKAGRVNRDETAITIDAVVTSAGKSDIIEHGFYYGSNADALVKVKVGDGIAVGEKFSYSVDIPETDLDVYYWYPYAVNSQGESRNSLSEFSRAYMDLSQTGTANCYLIQTPGKYKFNAMVRGNSTEPVGTAFTAEVIWEFCNPNALEPIIAEVNLNNGYVEFETTKEAQYGNALIAVKDVNGVILWSWHIWLCDFEPEVSAHKYKNGSVIMDRHLGATLSTFNSYEEKDRAAGTLYQWGRKDPMVPVTINEVRYGFETVEESLAYPMSFGMGDKWAYDFNETLWSSDQKTTYDPCPPGWMVSGSDAWNDIEAYGQDDFGLIFRYDEDGNSVRYPFGFYYDSNFNLTNAQDSFIWTSDYVRDTNCGWALYYSYWGWGLESGRWHTDAYSVRCMKDAGFIVSTLDAEATAESAVVYGNVRYTEATTVSERGFVFSQDNMEPTLSSANCVTAGSGEGDFSATLTDLNPNTRYWVRAYAMDEDATRYGRVIEFKTAVSGTGDDDFTEDDYEWE